MDMPVSMQAELASWNAGRGIDLAGYISAMGNFRLAVAYRTVFWPKLLELEGYILRDAVRETDLRQWEDGRRSRAAVEQVLNERHVADIHPHQEDISKDKLVFLGMLLKDILTAKLQWQYPERPCVVEFAVPADANDLMGYRVSFWQPANEQRRTQVRRQVRE